MKFRCESQTFLHVEVTWDDFSTVVLPLKQTFARDNKSTIKLKVFKSANGCFQYVGHFPE